MAQGSTPNQSNQYAGITTRFIAREAMEQTQRYLVLYQFSDKKTIPHGRGVQWEAFRWNYMNLPRFPTAEGVPPNPNSLDFTQVTGTAVQWAGRWVGTDVATITTQQDLMRAAGKQLGMQLAQLKERNGFVNMNAGTQINYANAVGSRASLAATDILNPTDVNRTYANLSNLGAQKWNGQTGETVERSIDYTARNSEKTIKGVEHYVAVASIFPLEDLRNNPTVVNAWSRSDVDRLYINQMGYWGGITFCETNMAPNWLGTDAPTGVNAVGNLTTGTYTIVVTGWDDSKFYESRISQLSADISVTTGGIQVTVPSTTGFTYAVYVGVGSGALPSQLGLTTSGPTGGSFAGQAIEIPPGTVVTITGLGAQMIPPAAPTSGVTVYPVYIFGREAFACLKLEGVQWLRPSGADKADQLDQLRVIGYKFMEGWTILDQRKMARIECSASNTGAFS
jgi:N4-gp56 family major capsid protein